MDQSPDTITLQEAADRLGVHYMTVYRYVRLGRLPAHKSGGTWEVSVADLEAFRHDTDPVARPRHPADWARRLEARLVAGDEAGAWGVVEAALASGMEPAGVYTEMLGPALESVGCRWHDGEISVAVEHLASAVAIRIVGRLGPRFARKGRTWGRVVVTTPEGEVHAIPSAMLSDLLRAAGFEVTDLGVDIPSETLAGIIERIGTPVAVCISATRAGSDREIRRAVKAVRASTDALVLVGGGAVVDAAHATSLGADGWAADGPGAVRMVLDSVTKA
jgi:excisionase family DNA binding protein